MKVRLGDFNKLRITRFCDSGAYLDTGNELEILMPHRYTTSEMHTGDEVEVFVYLDQGNRPVATTEQPLCKVGEFACLTVSWLNEYGAFLDWGLMKDLFVPFSEQKVKMQKGESYVVYVYVDDMSGRITASSKISKYISKEKPMLAPQQAVDALVYKRTELGVKVIILDTGTEGLIYNSELFQTLGYGEKVRAYVKKVRDDGKVDLIMQTNGRHHVEDFGARLLESLRSKPNGFIPLNDESAPEDIYDYFGVSKKTFKRAVGALYKEHLIKLEEDGIRLSPELD